MAAWRLSFINDWESVTASIRVTMMGDIGYVRAVSSVWPGAEQMKQIKMMYAATLLTDCGYAVSREP
ncbi:unnamed protein product [Danaus chrysippus]|uniref:(African queen) hypothetical protein n=1 Tax=Danaus chrysippus TaxID=151541 RepID=A0A8J2R968_9NEOP|nr:unnamed protein product [Danaus chrysippus]